MASGSAAVTGKKLNEAPTGHTANTEHRKGFGNDPYKSETANGVDSINCQAQLDINSKMDATTFNALFASYDVKAGTRVYVDNLSTSYKTLKDLSYEYSMTKPDYKFGEEYELSEEPQPLDGFNKYEPFEMSDFDASLSGKGFVKLEGNYQMVPNFETLMWQMTFSLEMPKQYFDPTKYVIFYGTYAPTTDLTDEHTITCEVKLGDVQSANVREYSKDFAFDKATATSRLTSSNAGALTDTEGYGRNYNPELY